MRKVEFEIQRFGMLRFHSDMASRSPRRVIWTVRDDDIATFLFRTAATPDLLFYASQTWNEPFASLDRTQRRLNALVQAGWLLRAPLAIASQIGSRYYYQLTLDGFRMWQRDPDAQPPTKRFFAPSADALHQHLYAKAQFLAHLTVVAHRRGFRIENDKPENTFTIGTGDRTIRPDHYLELVGPNGRRFAEFFEFDRSTETQTSTAQLTNTWTRKNLVYQSHQDTLGRRTRFRIIPVTTVSRERLENIMRLFAQQATIPNRQLYVGVYLPDFLAEDDALCHPIFADHRHSHIPLVPVSAVQLPPRAEVDDFKRRRSRRSASRAYDPMPMLRPVGWSMRYTLGPVLNQYPRSI